MQKGYEKTAIFYENSPMLKVEIKIMNVNVS